MLNMFDTMCQKRLRNQYILSFSIVVVLQSLVYYPIYLYLSSDIIWNQSSLYFVLIEVIEPLLQYLCFWLSFSFLIYSCARFSSRGSIPFLIVYAIGTVMRYLLQNLSYILIMDLSTWKNGFDLPVLLLSLAGDLLLMGCAFLIILAFMKWKDRSFLDRYFPLPGFFNMKSKLLKCTAIVAALPSAARLLTRIAFDLMNGIPKGAAGAVLVITYYVTDVLSAVIGYLFVYLLLSSFFLSDKKSKLHFEEK